MPDRVYERDLTSARKRIGPLAATIVVAVSLLVAVTAGLFAIQAAATRAEVLRLALDEEIGTHGNAATRRTATAAHSARRRRQPRSGRAQRSPARQVEAGGCGAACLLRA